MAKQFPILDDTIAAIATPTGPGGIGIVRLSGPDAVRVISEIFRSPSMKNGQSLVSRRVYHGHIYSDEAQCLDEVLVIVMRAPRSYTREDVVEIHCHGGLMPVKAVLELVVSKGARLAQPGEFTKRAFLNGRIDLVQAEAVLDMIQAKTKGYLRIGSSQLKGELTRELENIRQDLLGAYVRMEAILNFPEEGIEEQSRVLITEHLAGAHRKIDRLLQVSEQGRMIREGARIVLCGKPNVGKSSLLNVLLRHPRAIVSEVAGTTRDSIEEAAQIRGIPVQLIDTAGILTPRDRIEEEAVRRSLDHMGSADLVLFTISGAEPLEDEDLGIARSLGGASVIVVMNKSDLPSVIDEEKIRGVLPDCRCVRVSALDQSGIHDLEKEIENAIWKDRTMDAGAILVTNARHIESLREALTVVDEAVEHLRAGVSLELISENIKDALTALDRITGRDLDADVIDGIFSSFCIGK